VLTGDDGARLRAALATGGGQVVPRSCAGRVIMLDAGMRQRSRGAGRRQRSLGSAAEPEVSRKLVEAGTLRAKGYEVLQTRSADRFTSLGSRSDYAQRRAAFHLCLDSLQQHRDTGLQRHHDLPTCRLGGRSRLATCVHEAALAATGATDKSVRTANFFVLRETVMPSTLIECGFLTNATECRNLIDPVYQ